MRRDRLDRKAQRGFTLLELLVAIMLLGLIATMAFSGLRLGARVWETTDEHEHEVYLVQQLLRQRLGAAYFPFDFGVALSEDEPLFEGGPDHVSFIAPLPDRFGVPGLYRVSIEVVPSGNDSALVMSWRLWRPPDDTRAAAEAGREEPERRVLLDGVAHAAFAFFGPAEEFGRALAWQDQWQRPMELPVLVRIELDHKEQPWPPLVIAPRAAGAA